MTMPFSAHFFENVSQSSEGLFFALINYLWDTGRSGGDPLLWPIHSTRLGNFCTYSSWISSSIFSFWVPLCVNIFLCLLTAVCFVYLSLMLSTVVRLFLVINDLKPYGRLAGQQGEGKRRRGRQGWDGWITSPTQWIWTWAHSGRQWRTEKPGVLQSMGSQNWTQLSDWTTRRRKKLLCVRIPSQAGGIHSWE